MDSGMQYLLMWLVFTVGCSVGYSTRRVEIFPRGDRFLNLGDALNLSCIVQNCDKNSEPHWTYRHREDNDYHQDYETLQIDNCTLELFVNRMNKSGIQHFQCNDSTSRPRIKQILVFDPTIGNVSCNVYSEDYTTTMSCGGWCYNNPDPGTTWEGTIRYGTNPLKSITDCNVTLPFNGCGDYSFYLKKAYTKKASNSSHVVNISTSQVKVKVARLSVDEQTPGSVLVSWDPHVLNVTDNCPTPTPHYWISYITEPPSVGEEVRNVTEYLGINVDTFNITNISPNTTIYIEIRTSFDNHTRGQPKKLKYTTTAIVVPETSTPAIDPTVLAVPATEVDVQIIAILCGTLAAATVIFVTQLFVRRWYRRNRTVITTPPPPSPMNEMNGERWTMDVRCQNSDYTMLPYDTN